MIPTALGSAGLSDQPIAAVGDDQLGRAEFARRLADLIASAHAEKGLVVGLVGPWGEGKTSLLNMTKSVLRASYLDHVRVLEFNPWYWSGTGQLILRFLSELTRTFELEPGWVQIAPLLRKYAATVSRLADLTGPTAPWIKALTSLVNVLADLLGHRAIDRGNLEAWRNLVRDRIVQAHARSAPFDAGSVPMGRKGRQRRAPRFRRLVVLIDDIDRLQDQEIHEIAQMVKLVADFPQIVYVLAYDRARVERALSSSDSAKDGRAYLSKIVQVPLSLPAPDPQVLRRVVEKTVTQVAPLARGGEEWQIGWSGLYDEALAPFLSNLRDAKRFASGLLVSVTQIESDVDLIDLIGVTALRVFVPEVYDLMREDPELFLGATFDDDVPPIAKARAELETALEGLDARRRRLSMRVLSRLFPYVEYVLAGEERDPDELPTFDPFGGSPPHVNSRRSYWRYLALARPADEIAETDLRALLDAITHEPGAFWPQAEPLFRTGVGTDLLRRLSHWSKDEEVDSVILATAAQQLLAHADQLPPLPFRTVRSVVMRGYLLAKEEEQPAVLEQLIHSSHWSGLRYIDDGLAARRPATKAAMVKSAAAKLATLSADAFRGEATVPTLQWFLDVVPRAARKRIAQLLASDEWLLALLQHGDLNVVRQWDGVQQRATALLAGHGPELDAQQRELVAAAAGVGPWPHEHQRRFAESD